MHCGKIISDAISFLKHASLPGLAVPLARKSWTAVATCASFLWPL